MSKAFDLAVKVGSYTNAQGEVKNRYKNIGVVMNGQHGQYILLDKTFNPAGIVDEKDSVMVSMFEPRQQDPNQALPGQAAPQQAYAGPANNQAMQQPVQQQPVQQGQPANIPF